MWMALESLQLSKVTFHRLWTGNTHQRCTGPLFHVTIQIHKFFSMLNKWCAKEIILGLSWNMQVRTCMTSVWSMKLYCKKIATVMSSNRRVFIEPLENILLKYWDEHPWCSRTISKLSISHLTRIHKVSMVRISIGHIQEAIQFNFKMLLLSFGMNPIWRIVVANSKNSTDRHVPFMNHLTVTLRAGPGGPTTPKSSF